MYKVAKKFQDSNEAQAFIETLESMINDERLAEYLASTDRNFDTNTIEGLKALKYVAHKLSLELMMSQ